MCANISHDFDEISCATEDGDASYQLEWPCSVALEVQR